MNTGLLRYVVATVLTVYGIETIRCLAIVTGMLVMVATVLTVYGIETVDESDKNKLKQLVATVLTVYGIETCLFGFYNSI